MDQVMFGMFESPHVKNFNHSHRIHGAGISMLTWLSWWDPWHTIYGTMDPSWDRSWKFQCSRGWHHVNLDLASQWVCSCPEGIHLTFLLCKVSLWLVGLCGKTWHKNPTPFDSSFCLTVLSRPRRFATLGCPGTGEISPSWNAPKIATADSRKERNMFSYIRFLHLWLYHPVCLYRHEHILTNIYI